MILHAIIRETALESTLHRARILLEVYTTLHEDAAGAVSGALGEEGNAARVRAVAALRGGVAWAGAARGHSSPPQPPKFSRFCTDNPCGSGSKWQTGGTESHG